MLSLLYNITVSVSHIILHPLTFLPISQFYNSATSSTTIKLGFPVKTGLISLGETPGEGGRDEAGPDVPVWLFTGSVRPFFFSSSPKRVFHPTKNRRIARLFFRRTIR